MSLETEKVPWRKDGKCYVVGGEISVHNKHIIIQGQVLVIPNIDEEGNDGYMSMGSSCCFHLNNKKQLVASDVCLTKQQKIECNGLLEHYYQGRDVVPYNI